MLSSLPLVGLHSISMIGTETMLIVLVVVLVLFGGSKIPQLFRGVGQGIGEFHKGLDEGKRAAPATADDKPASTEIK
jgi:sec-independent protein translocase protein TatA